MTPNHYEVLSIPSGLLESTNNSALNSSILKKAYHRTLLRYHPDKTIVSDKTDSVVDTNNHVYTIDEINTAFKVLSNPLSKREYDEDLRLRLKTTSPTSNGAVTFRTGLDAVDLDDMEYHEDSRRFTKSCRCGADEGYLITENDMDEIEKELDMNDPAKQAYGSSRSMIIGCLGCSLWLQVDWAVCDPD